MPRKTQAQALESWERIVRAVMAHDEVPPRLLEQAKQLHQLLAEARKTVIEQREAEGLRQVATHRLSELQEDGERMATLLRLGLKMEFGHTNPKLVEFNVKPFRRRRRVLEPIETREPEPTDPSSPTPLSEPTTE
jgi:hypothetical protein